MRAAVYRGTISRRVSIFALAGLLASCGGSSGGGGTPSYSVGGTVSGLAGPGLVLRDNGGDDLAVAADGKFTFATAIADGGSYSVSVLAQPAATSCAVSGASGTVSGGNVTGVAVNCTLFAPAAPTVGLTFSIKQLHFSWPAVAGADFYRVQENPDGVSGYAQVATNITAFAYTLTIPVHLRANASYIVDACNAAGCTSSAPTLLGTGLVPLMGFMKVTDNPGTDLYGDAIAVSGDGNTLAVGAYGRAGDTGAVYVYARGAGDWPQEAFLPSPSANLEFGLSVALSEDGNTLAVGSLGGAYIFRRSAGVWSQPEHVTPAANIAAIYFSSQIALSADGNTLAVGAPFDSSNATGINGNQADTSASQAGAAYVFTHDAGGWSQQAYVKASNTGAGDNFGSSVALSKDGDTLAVGAVGESSNAPGIDGNQADNSLGSAGAAYVFTRSAGVWSQQAYVKASNPGASDQYGISVALSGNGDTLAVGSWNENSSSTTINGAPNDLDGISGAVYVYTRDSGTWSQQAYVKASNHGGALGSSVALSADGNMLAAGALANPFAAVGVDGADGTHSVTFSGAAYVFVRSADTWSQRSYLKSTFPEEFDEMGKSIALSSDGSTLAVGAWLATGNVTDSGAAYLY